MTINTICVCGAGTMGSGIAQSAAQAGIHTILFELNATALEKAKKNIENSLSRLVEKSKMSDTGKKEVLQRLVYTTELHDCLADVFIEAIIEKTEIKIGLFNQLAEINHSESVFATNTSSLSVTKIAEGVVNPQRVIGMHFFNPATIMKLVEIVKTPYTNDQTTNLVKELARLMGKTAVLCIDSPGFIVNRVARPYYIESLRIAEEGENIEQVDRIMESSGFKMGPFKLMDLIGNDINYAVSCSVYDQLGKPGRLQPSSIQEEKIKQGKLGKKSGEGYYKYDQS